MNKQVAEKETNFILASAQNCLGLAGDFVELGCYKGDTSLLLARILAGSNKKLWIYDSFAGLPARSREDGLAIGTEFSKGELLVTKNEVMNKFRRASLPLPICKKAFFEELDSKLDLPSEIAFAFLDGDLYGSIRTSLALVENKMVDGGIIIVHDYNNPKLPGVAKAVDEWLSRANQQCRIYQTCSLISYRKSARRP